MNWIGCDGWWSAMVENDSGLPYDMFSLGDRYFLSNDDGRIEMADLPYEGS